MEQILLEFYFQQFKPGYSFLKTSVWAKEWKGHIRKTLVLKDWSEDIVKETLSQIQEPSLDQCLCHSQCPKLVYKH